jgi:hypothetical protein
MSELKRDKAVAALAEDSLVMLEGRMGPRR